MTISIVGTAIGDTGNLTLPGLQAGDLCFLFFWRDESSNASPTGTAAWPSIYSNVAGSTRVALYRHVVAADGDVTSDLTFGTGVNVATSVLMVAFRGCVAPETELVRLQGSTAVVGYGGLALADSDGSSWVAAFTGHASTVVGIEADVGALPVIAYDRAAVDGVALHAGPVASWTGEVVTFSGSTTFRWSTISVALEADPAAGGRRRSPLMLAPW